MGIKPCSTIKSLQIFPVLLALLCVSGAISAQEPDEMYNKNINNQPSASEQVKQITGADSVGTAAVVKKKLKALQIDINTVTRLAEICEERLLQISKDALDLNQPASDLEALQKERERLLKLLDTHKTELVELNKRKAELQKLQREVKPIIKPD